MMRIIYIFALISLLLINSQASADEKITNKLHLSAIDEDNVFLNDEEIMEFDNSSYSESNKNWYENAVKRISGLRVNNILLGRFILSIDDNVEVSTPTSGITTTRLTIGNPGIAVLPYTGDYNLGLGMTTRINKKLSVATSVSMALSGSPDVTFWVALPAIRF